MKHPPSKADLSTEPAPTERLRREVGVLGATMMGLGSILGTGIFVSIGTAAGAAGPAALLAIGVAALVATCNGLSSAQLASNHPVSGGTYEYGYRWLNPTLGFTAGWMFLCAKSASAATAALGLAGYALQAMGRTSSAGTVIGALAVVTFATLLVSSGIRRSNQANVAIVSVTIASLAALVVAGSLRLSPTSLDHLTPWFSPRPGSTALGGFLEACALMFVAFTGYGRIATLGEEVADPRQNIPRAIVATLVVSALLYLLVGLVAIAAVGAEALAEATHRQAAPLEYVARQLNSPVASAVVSVGAITAMLGVLLNLILGLSRVLLAMGRRGDFPPIFAKLDQQGSTPYVAVLAVAAGVGTLTLLGDVKTTWSFSAFTVLIYYALTNLATIRLAPGERTFPALIAWLGLFACLFLAFWVPPRIWLWGLGLIAVGLLWQQSTRRFFGTRPN